MRVPGTPKFRSPWQCDWHGHRGQVPFQPLTPLSSMHSCQLWCLCRSCIWGEVFLLHKISHFPNVFSITCAYTHLHTRSHMHTHAGTQVHTSTCTQYIHAQFWKSRTHAHTLHLGGGRTVPGLAHLCVTLSVERCMASGHRALPGGTVGVLSGPEQGCSLCSRLSLHLMLNTHKKPARQGLGLHP